MGIKGNVSRGVSAMDVRDIKVNITIVKRGVDEVDIADGNYDLMVINRGRLKVLVVLVKKEEGREDYMGRLH